MPVTSTSRPEDPMRTIIVCCAAALLATACHKNDPNSVEDQVKLLKDGKTSRDRERALEHLRKIGKKEAVPGMLEALKSASSGLKPKIVVALGDLKDASAVDGLVEAIDMSVGNGTDKATADANTANKEISRALGEIGDKKAAAPLTKLLKATRNDYVRLETIEALGHLKDATAVPVLVDFAGDERLETLVNKKAIQALSEINSPEALPVYLQMLFAERKGVSFYPESAYGIFKLGNAANDKILAVLKGEDKALIKWAKEREVLEPAIYAKAAQIESDLQDRRAIPELLKLLKYEDARKDYQQIVRMNAADSLGRMRAKEAVGPIAAMLTEPDSTSRGAFMRALVQIGDAAATPKLSECMKNGDWSAREYCVLGLSLIGGAKDVKAIESVEKEEPGMFDKECGAGNYGDVDCAKEKAKNVENRLKNIASYKKALEVVSKCDNDAKCLEKLLADGEPVVREHAAYELGRRGAVDSLPALMTAIKREVTNTVDLNPRFAAICAVDWIAASNAKAMAAAKAEVNSLFALVEKEKRVTLTMRIAEEVQRLAVKLDRG